MEAIVYRQENGKLAVCYPTGEVEISLVRERVVPQNSPFRICGKKEIPADGTFFDAWIYDETVTPCPVSIDETTACEIQRNRWRESRKPLLELLDVKWIRASEEGNTALCNEISQKKTILRNVTNTPLPSRATGESIEIYSQRLSSVWPECLK